MKHLGRILEWFDTHAAAANWGLVILALVAAIIAYRQMKEARAQRFSAARPYVVIGLRRVGIGIVELYIRNYGQTAAYDLTMKSSPPLSSLSHASWFKTFDKLHTLAPGDEWATIWETDSGLRSAEGAGPNVYTVTLDYTGKDGTKAEPLKDTFTLDWQPYLDSTFVERKNLHDVGQSLEKIQKAITKLSRRPIFPLPQKEVEQPTEPPPSPVMRFVGLLARFLG